ncbi:MAG: SPOR domain-containing protein [Crocinitomicaceae bacterium]
MIKYLLAFLLFFSAFHAQSQSDADTLSNVLRPRIGLGVGTMTYYGEIQNYQKKFIPTMNRFHGMAYVNAPITRYFNLELTASYGKIVANERSLVSNLNFQSRIRMFSAQLYYNFYPMLSSPKTMFHPFVGLGFSSFEFLSKTDLYDANGNEYHYWSDGSIMNMSEDNPLAENAIPLMRDYTYETDLREQNLDSLGDYREQSFAIPISAGIEFHLSPRWDFRVATTYYFTFTDLIDNISPAGEGPIRHGDGRKDMLWTTYVSLSYDLQLPKEKGFDPMDDRDIELYVDFEQNDWDKDGVIDAYDECPGTPLEALVDEKGCPLDMDNDGVPDYMDDEPNTPEGNMVNEFGVTLTEEDIARHWKEFNDSTGYDHPFVEDKKIVEFGKEGVVQLVDPYADRKDKSYVVIIGKEHKDISANELHKYLGYNEFKTELRGDTVYYILGEYATIEDAVAAQEKIEEEGIDVELIGRDGSVDSTFFAIDPRVVEKVKEDNNNTGRVGPEVGKSDQQVYRVQIGAFKNKVNTSEAFPEIEDITFAKGEDGITRYYSGKYEDYKKANAHRKKLISKGYRSAFVVAYKGHERKTLRELGIDPNDLPDNYNEDKELNSFVESRTEDETDTTGGNNIINGIDMSRVKYRLKIAEYPEDADIPNEDLDIFLNIGDVKPVRAESGKMIYYSKPFPSKEAAINEIDRYKTYGLEDMVPIIEYDGDYFTVEEFEEKLKP